METISNVASGVSKAIWGEGTTAQNNETAGTEPISGQKGEGTVDSPYDQGNSETTTAADTNNKPIGVYNETSSTSTSTEPTTTASTSNPTASTTSGVSDPTGGPDPTKPDPSKTLENTDKTGVTGATPGDPAKAADISPSNAQSNTGAPVGGNETQKQQGADRPLEEPTEKKEEETAKPTGSGSNDKKPAADTMGSNPDNKGTGEQYVKTSGLAVDGGDFDATKPGAGHEAERLMDEKGIHHSDPTDKTPAPPSPEEKKGSKMDKLKEKLHIGHKDK